MKLEKISDTQIRCTLNREDLNDRELRISELAYGSEKAKALFRDMMQQAAYEFGFEADDIPLMIESIPISPDCLILNITKVEDPDELDTRFSSFTPSADIDEFSDDNSETYADEIISCFEHIAEIMEKREESIGSLSKTKLPGSKKGSSSSESIIPASLIKVYSFTSLKEITRLSRILVSFYVGENTLYKNPADNRYYLVLSISNHKPEEFNKVYNIISEFGRAERATYASTAYFREHFHVIVKDCAIQVLANY